MVRGMRSGGLNNRSCCGRSDERLSRTQDHPSDCRGALQRVGHRLLPLRGFQRPGHLSYCGRNGNWYSEHRVSYVHFGDFSGQNQRYHGGPLPAGHHPGSAAGLPCQLYHPLRKRFGHFLQPMAAEDFLFRDVARDAGQRERGDSVLPDYRLLHPGEPEVAYAQG